MIDSPDANPSPTRAAPKSHFFSRQNAIDEPDFTVDAYHTEAVMVKIIHITG
jgi:hypothetical protein